MPHGAADGPRRNGAVPSVRIEHDDCVAFLDGLAPGSVDVIVTDPAYSGMNNKLQLGKGRIVGQYRDRGTAESKWFAEFEDTAENYARFLSACRRALNPQGHIYLMFDSFSLLSLAPIVREFFDVKNVITWDKVAIGMGHYFRRRHEYILFATNANNRKIRTRSMPDVWRFKRVKASAYSTQKPVEVFEAMLYASAPNGAVVCDPFLGSGSSAVAAIRHGCAFVGCDAATWAVELARERVATYMASGRDPLQPASAAVPGEPVFWRADGAAAPPAPPLTTE